MTGGPAAAADPAAARVLHAVLPADVTDPGAVSGGNAYDRRVCHELERLGWRVRTLGVAGSWPRPAPADAAELGRVLAGVPDGGVVLLDGLVGCGLPEVVVPQAARLRLAVLVHLPLADETGLPPAVATDLDERERAVLAAAGAVVVTSPWAAGRLATTRARVDVAAPGTDPVPPAAGTDGSSLLLCVAALRPRKAQDVLVEALAEVADRPWSLVCAGPLDRDPAFVAGLRERTARHRIDSRVRLAGPLTGPALDAAYDAADLTVLVSRTETYGMVVTESLARGVPVLASAAGALPDTLGRAPDGSRPGLLVPAGDVAALAAALARWLDEPALRDRLRRSARGRRGILTRWDETARHLHRVLDRLRRDPTGTAP